MKDRNKEKNIDLKTLTQWLEKIDPFDIPLEEFKALRKGKYRSLADRIIMKQLYKNYGSWIETQFKERQGIHALVVCDRQVILSTEDEYGPSGQQIDEIELKMGKPCYLVSREPLIEENASWTNPRLGCKASSFFFFVIFRASSLFRDSSHDYPLLKGRGNIRSTDEPSVPPFLHFVE